MDINRITQALQKATSLKEVHLEIPEREEHGDYATNVAMVIAKKKKKNPIQVGLKIKDKLLKDKKLIKYISKISVVPPGFINFWLSQDCLVTILHLTLKEREDYGKLNILKGKKLMVEFAHPNTHKELHIGHIRTLVLGESLSRILKVAGATVFRANYQGDIGPHVAKAIWGTTRLIKKRRLSWEKVEKKTLSEKSRLLGEGYVLGNQKYKSNKKEIDDLNFKLYQNDKSVLSVYKRTRRWSLEYYDSMYKRFGTKFDKLYFESTVSFPGKEIVLNKLNKVFKKSKGAVIFDGEKYGLHKRVFVTKEGHPTYEAKDMALAPLQYKDFQFDRNVHVVANEQMEYFKVVFKALELVDEKFKGKQYHLPMGMVNLVGKKMSSRAGVIVNVDDLLETIQNHIVPLLSKEFHKKDKAKVAEIITIGAIKYSMLKVNPISDVVFDIEKSIDLQGNSGPYLQYTYARIRSVLRKSSGEKKSKPARRQVKKYGVKQKIVLKVREPVQRSEPFIKRNKDELALMRSLTHYPEVIMQAAVNYAPNHICNYLFDLAGKYNRFYNQHRILNLENDKNNSGMERSIMVFRLILTTATGQVLENGLNLLGIQAPERM